MVGTDPQPTSRIITGIDLPFDPTCGSVILADDLYGALGGEVTFVTLASTVSTEWSQLSSRNRLHQLRFTASRASFPKQYDEFLLNGVRGAMRDFGDEAPEIHIHHLTFGMARALRTVSGGRRVTAFCHGSDILAGLNSREHHDQIKATCDLADRLIFPSRSLLKLTEDRICKLGDRAEVIPWGIPDSYFNEITRSPSRHLRRPDSFNILYAGRLNKNKGLWVLAEALRELPSNFRVHALCDNSGTHIEGTTPDFDRGERLTIHDFLPRRQLCEAFDDFDCIVIPTVYLEAFGLVALEAQSRGLPVISSDLDSLKEVMGEAALYFKAGCSHSLAGTLKLLAEDHDLREELSLKARASSNQFRLHRLTERISIYSNKADERE